MCRVFFLVYSVLYHNMLCIFRGAAGGQQGGYSGVRYPAGYGGAAAVGTMNRGNPAGGYPANTGYGGAMYGAQPMNYGYGYNAYG